jgi:hypothetical protein
MLLAYANRFGIPNAGLNLADVSASHHQHTKARLTYTASNGERQLARKKHFMERKLAPRVTAAK